MNDDFANAHPLTGAAGSVEDSNRYALLENAETSHAGVATIGQTVWYRWVEPSVWVQWPPWYTFDLTQGTTFDSVLAVYAGDSIDALTAVAGNDDQGTARGSRLSFPAEPGSAYAIVVASKSALDPTAAGNFRLRWYPTPPPGFTGSQFSPVRGMPGSRVTLTGINFTGATAVLFGDANAAFTNALTNNLDLRITAAVPPDATSGPITVVTPHGNVTSTANFRLPPPPLTVRRMAEGRIEISWSASSDEVSLEAAGQLPAPVWEPVSALPQRSDGQSRVLVDHAESARFFRLRGAL